MNKIFAKAYFGEFKDVTREQALKLAKYVYYRSTTGKKGEELLNMINNHFKGIKFTLEEIRNG